MNKVFVQYPKDFEQFITLADKHVSQCILECGCDVALSKKVVADGEIGHTCSDGSIKYCKPVVISNYLGYKELLEHMLSITPLIIGMGKELFVINDVLLIAKPFDLPGAEWNIYSGFMTDWKNFFDGLDDEQKKKFKNLIKNQLPIQLERLIFG